MVLGGLSRTRKMSKTVEDLKATVRASQEELKKYKEERGKRTGIFFRNLGAAGGFYDLGFKNHHQKHLPYFDHHHPHGV